MSAPTVLPLEEATDLDAPAAHRGPGELPPPPVVITTHRSPLVEEPTAGTDPSAGNRSGAAAASAPLTAALPRLALLAELNVATAVPGTARRLLVRYATPLRTTPLRTTPLRTTPLRTASADELRLVAAPAPVRPRASLGFLWGIALLGALFVGPIEVAVLVAPVAFFAAASGLRFGCPVRFGRPVGADPPKKSPLVAIRRRLCLAAAVGAIPVVALVGPLAAVLLAVALAALVAALGSRGAYERGPVLAITLAPALAAGSLVLARRESLTLSILLVAATGLYDIAACLMGTGRDGGRPALIAGLATMGMFGFVVSAIANPPLGGPWPWIVCGLIGLLAAAAVRVVSRLVVPGRAPAMRRLDSLALAGPVWVVLVLVAFHS